MTIHEATRYSIDQLKKLGDEAEAAAIVDWVIAHLTGTKKTDRVIQKGKELSAEQETELQQYLQRLSGHEPVQYVLNESWFCGLKFYVDKNVLIPRPETEELVEWVIANCKFPVDRLRILDIGTGSGCIAISLKRKLRKAEVWACDSSEAALNIARRNAESLGTDVRFSRLDFLDEIQRRDLPSFDIIVSNPPYIPEKESGQLQANVINYEPATALFVPDNDPLVFYKAIAAFGKDHLAKKGTIYTEIHESLGKEAIAVFQSHNYSTELKKDMSGKDRMLRCIHTN